MSDPNDAPSVRHIDTATPEEYAAAVADNHDEADALLPPHTTQEARRASIANHIARARTSLSAAGSRVPDVFRAPEPIFRYQPPLTPADLEGERTVTYTDAFGNQVTTIRDPRDRRQRYDPTK